MFYDKKSFIILLEFLGEETTISTKEFMLSRGSSLPAEQKLNGVVHCDAAFAAR